MALLHFLMVSLVVATSALAVHDVLVPREPIEVRPVLDKRMPHPAVLHSPKRGADLVLGGSFEVIFNDGETTATAIQAVLSNSTYTYALKAGDSPSIPFASYSSQSILALPSQDSSQLSPGAYSFSIYENSDADPTDFTSAGPAASIEVRVVAERAVELAGDKRFRTQINLTRSKELEGVERRAQHPGGISQPNDGATLTAGQSFHLSMNDGETTADKVQVVLRSSGGSSSTLGTAPFDNFTAEGDFTVPSDTSSGSYTIEVQENASFDEQTFTDAFSVSVTVSSSGGDGSGGSSSSSSDDGSSTSTTSSSSPTNSSSPTSASASSDGSGSSSSSASGYSSASSAASSHRSSASSAHTSTSSASTPSASSVSRIMSSASVSSVAPSPSSSSGAASVALSPVLEGLPAMLGGGLLFLLAF